MVDRRRRSVKAGDDGNGPRRPDRSSVALWVAIINLVATALKIVFGKG
ncbi:MAG TPA: hypothetical protein VH539_15115 [Gemmatimonadaceae bacterium]|jgi:hypothetical protein